MTRRVYPRHLLRWGVNVEGFPVYEDERRSLVNAVLRCCCDGRGGRLVAMPPFPADLIARAVRLQPARESKHTAPFVKRTLADSVVRLPPPGCVCLCLCVAIPFVVHRSTPRYSKCWSLLRGVRQKRTRRERRSKYIPDKNCHPFSAITAGKSQMRTLLCVDDGRPGREQPPSNRRASWRWSNVGATATTASQAQHLQRAGRAGSEEQQRVRGKGLHFFRSFDEALAKCYVFLIRRVHLSFAMGSEKDSHVDRFV